MISTNLEINVQQIPKTDYIFTMCQISKCLTHAVSILKSTQMEIKIWLVSDHTPQYSDVLLLKSIIFHGFVFYRMKLIIFHGFFPPLHKGGNNFSQTDILKGIPEFSIT